jgi:Domain of unknown function (DUF1918)
MTKEMSAEVLAGDRVEVVGHRVGDTSRGGEIVEVLGAAPNQHFRVRWQDGHMSLLYPSSDVVVIHQQAPAARKPGRAARP